MTDENRGDFRAGRDPSSGKFTRGNPGGPGRRPGATVSSELRRLADPSEIAERLLAIINSPKTTTKDRLRAIELLADRTEGKAIGRSVSIRTAASTLPPGFAYLDPRAQDAILAEIRSRACAGELPPTGDDVGDDDGEV